MLRGTSREPPNDVCAAREIGNRLLAKTVHEEGTLCNHRECLRGHTHLSRIATRG